MFVTKCWIFRWGGGGLHSDVSSWTERWPCFRNYEFEPWLYFLTNASKFVTVLKLAKICIRAIVTTETMHTKFIFASTKTISILKLIYGKINDFRFRTVLKYIVLCDVILRCKQRWYEHCIILKRQVQVVLVILPLTTIVGRYLGSHAGSNIHEHGARGRMFPADDGGLICFIFTRSNILRILYSPFIYSSTPATDSFCCRDSSY